MNSKENKSEMQIKMDNLRKMPMKKLPNYLYDMIARKNELIETGEVNNKHIFISQPNRKGAPHSVSTIPVYNCGKNCKLCKLSCYDLRHDARTKQVRETRAINAAILESDPERYFREIDGACKLVDKFRWHVGGDVTSMFYWENVVKIAQNNPHCKFHIFTKSYEIVNEWISNNGNSKDCLPENMNLRFSGWPGVDMPNPYDIGTAVVVFDDDFIIADSETALCTSNCTNCLIHGTGCANSCIKRILLPVH